MIYRIYKKETHEMFVIKNKTGIRLFLEKELGIYKYGNYTARQLMGCVPKDRYWVIEKGDLD